MKLTGLFLIAVCVLCGCQRALAAKGLRGLREKATSESADYTLEGRPEERRYRGRDDWERWDKDAQSYRWSLADQDIEEVSYWFMEKLWWYLFGTDDVRGKTWWKLRKSFRNYLREWWITTPWAGVGTLKTGVWYALSKLTFEELPAWWGGTLEYEKMKELLNDDEAIDQWTENIQRRLIWDKRDPSGWWWKPDPWDYMGAEDRWDWEDSEKKSWWRDDQWWDRDRHRNRGAWDSKRDGGRDWWDWGKKIRWRDGEGWDKNSWKRRGRWDTRDDGRWDWEKRIRRRGDDWWDKNNLSKWPKDERKQGRSGWTGRGPWDAPYLDWHAGGWSWDSQWEGGNKEDQKPWRRTWGDEGKWGVKPWKKRGKDVDDKWDPRSDRMMRKDDGKWERGAWKRSGMWDWADTVSTDEGDEGRWSDKWEGDEKRGRKPWKK